MRGGIIFLIIIHFCFAYISNLTLSGSLGQSGIMGLLLQAEFEGSAGKEIMLNLSGPLDSVVVRDRSGLILQPRIEHANGSTLIYATVPEDYLEYETTAQSLTSKEGNIWSMELSAGSSEEIRLLGASISLPQDAVLKSTNGDVQAGGGLLLVKWSAANIDSSHRAVMRLSYQTAPGAPAGQEGADYAPFILGGLAILIIAPAAYALFNRGARNEASRLQPVLSHPAVGSAPPASAAPAAPTTNPVIESLDETDKEIILHIMASGGKTTQARIYLGTHVPKATLSRRLASLENRGLIIRSKKGNRKLVSAGPPLRS